jgi:DNA polymerase III subunit delta
MKKSARQDAPADQRARVYLLFGDEFLVKERVRELVHEFLEPEFRDLNLVVLDGTNLDISELSSQLFTHSLFGARRVVVVDQTPLFMARADQRKIVAKVVEAWGKNDRKAALRAFAQMLNLVGVGSQELERTPESLADALDESVSAKEKEILSTVAEAFLAAGKRSSGGTDESAVEEMIVSALPSGTTLLFTAPDVDKRKKLFKVLEKHGKVVECAAREEKYGAGIEKGFFEERVRGSLQRAGKTISGAAITKMYARSGKDLRRLHAELDKLVGFLGSRTEVTVADVEAVFSDFHQAGTFDLNNALRTGDVAKCLLALHENLKIVETPLWTLGAIANDVRKLMVGRELLFTVFRSSWKTGMSFSAFAPVLKKAREDHPELMTKGKFHLLASNDYALYYTLRDAQKFPMERLVRCMEEILRADVMMKSTRLATHAPEAILDQVVLTLCGAAQPPRRASDGPAGRGPR